VIEWLDSECVGGIDKNVRALAYRSRQAAVVEWFCKRWPADIVGKNTECTES
jgi:hypothetical protein